jgi:hypothetical protein
MSSNMQRENRTVDAKKNDQGTYPITGDMTFTIGKLLRGEFEEKGGMEDKETRFLPGTLVEDGALLVENISAAAAFVAGKDDGTTSRGY